MALQTANQFNLTPDIAGQLSKGIQGGQNIAGQFQIGRQREQQIESSEELAASKRLVNSALHVNSLPDDQKLAALQQNRKSIIDRGGNTADTDAAIALAEAGNFEELNQGLQGVISVGERQGLIKSEREILGAPVTATPKAFAPIVDPNTGQLGVPTFDPSTGQAGFDVIEDAPLQQTIEQKRLADIESKQKTAEIDISKTERKEIIKQKVARTSKIKTELSERNRGAARSQRMLSQALTLAQQASQGLSGSAKLQLSRLVPGIDATDEAGLDATLKQLALEQLQQFKGPTTDFEFGVTQSIAGALGQSKESNIARIKSLDRARYFNETEFKQFNQFTKDGGDPDNFRFNFQEVVKTNKGPFSLQDLQDTAVQNNLTIEETIKRLNQ